MGVDFRGVHSLCVNCGPNVRVDEDGLCATCGATCTGQWLDEQRAEAEKAVLEDSAWCQCGHEHSRYTVSGRPVKRCEWVFCCCPSFARRSIPGKGERAALSLKTKVDLAKYRLKQERR